MSYITYNNSDTQYKKFNIFEGWLKSFEKMSIIDKNNKMICAPSEDSDQPGHQPSLIRVFAVHMKKAWVLSYPLSAQQRLWSDWADAQTDLSLRWAQTHFVGFVTSMFISLCCIWLLIWNTTCLRYFERNVQLHGYMTIPAEWMIDHEAIDTLPYPS